MTSAAAEIISVPGVLNKQIIYFVKVGFTSRKHLSRGYSDTSQRTSILADIIAKLVRVVFVLENVRLDPLARIHSTLESVSLRLKTS